MEKVDKKTKLWVPPEYKLMSKEEIDAVTGGCGPGGFGDYLVPDTIWGLNIFDACRIHDFMYHLGETIDDKEQADRVFLNNMLRMVYNKTRSKILRVLRVRRAKIYYWFVRECGGPAFWENKNKDDEYVEV